MQYLSLWWTRARISEPFCEEIFDIFCTFLELTWLKKIFYDQNAGTILCLQSHDPAKEHTQFDFIGKASELFVENILAV